MQQFATDHGKILEFGYIDFNRVKANAGLQFTSEEFKIFCQTNGLGLSLAAPKKLSQNHFADRTWQTVHNMAWSILIHAHQPNMYLFHAIIYTVSIFNILPVKDLFDPQGSIATPTLLFTGSKPV